MTTKEFTIQNAKSRIEEAKKSANSLNEEDKAAAMAAIEEMEAKVAELEATDEVVSKEDIIKELTAVINEKFAALEEKEDEPEQEQETETTMQENYLETKNAARDFFNAARQSANADQFNAVWGAKLSENGISFTTSNDPNYLPSVVKGAITDAWENAGWVRRLKNTGAKRYAIRYNSSTQTDETSRAKGHKNGETKVGETITLNSKTLTPQMIYKLIDIDNLTIWNDDNSLLKYVADECVRQWIWEVGHAVLVGDGRNAPSSNNPDLRISGIESVARASSDAFVTVSAHSAQAELIDEVVAMRAAIRDDAQDVCLFMSMTDINTLRKVVFGTNATPQYQPLAVIAEMIGVNEIIPCSTLGNTYKAIMFSLKEYALAGENTPAFKASEDIKTNITTWRYEAPIAGALEGLKSAAVLTA